MGARCAARQPCRPTARALGRDLTLPTPALASPLKFPLRFAGVPALFNMKRLIAPFLMEWGMEWGRQREHFFGRGSVLDG